mmetsp:Transcript_71822/g.142514  ORF Transcript_71822/g.142514 Transcript_71822/m.142514 type:complete len:276 (+) Transcript_71822:1184-2011(+)
MRCTCLFAALEWMRSSASLWLARSASQRCQANKSSCFHAVSRRWSRLVLSGIRAAALVGSATWNVAMSVRWPSLWCQCFMCPPRRRSFVAPLLTRTVQYLLSASTQRQRQCKREAVWSAQLLSVPARITSGHHLRGERTQEISYLASEELTQLRTVKRCTSCTSVVEVVFPLTAARSLVWGCLPKSMTLAESGCLSLHFWMPGQVPCVLQWWMLPRATPSSWWQSLNRGATQMPRRKCILWLPSKSWLPGKQYCLLTGWHTQDAQLYRFIRRQGQ